MLVTKTALPEHSTEAFTWTTSALLAGVGIGLAAGGMMLERLPASRRSVLEPWQRLQPPPARASF
jgi:hypothetical protein